jgi:hypothetical protein
MLDLASQILHQMAEAASASTQDKGTLRGEHGVEIPEHLLQWSHHANDFQLAARAAQPLPHSLDFMITICRVVHQLHGTKLATIPIVTPINDWSRKRQAASQNEMPETPVAPLLTSSKTTIAPGRMRSSSIVNTSFAPAIVVVKHGPHAGSGSTFITSHQLTKAPTMTA